MRNVSAEWIPEDGMVLLTLKTVLIQASFLIADFKDHQAAIFAPTGHFIGLTLDRGIRLGKRPAFMRNGIWLLHEETEVPSKYINARITIDNVVLGEIL